jgi:hypothetical protein
MFGQLIARRRQALPNLADLAERLETQARSRHAFLLVAALASIILAGYHFGTFDQFAHLPFLKYYADPTLYPNDQYIHEMSRQNYSYFWRLLAPVYQLDLRYASQVNEMVRPLILGSVMGAIHVLATYLTFWAVWALSLEIFDHAETALFSVLAFIVPHLGFGGFPALEFSLLNRTFALPFELWAIVFYLRRRTWLAFLCLGLMYNIHIISVNFVLAMFVLDAVRRWREVGWRTLVVGLGMFLLGAAPVLLWRIADPPIALRPDPEWFSVMTRGTLYNLFFMVAPYLHINLVTLFGLSTLAMYAIGQRLAPPVRHAGTLLNFIVALVAILLVQVFTSYVYPITILVQLQIIRAGVFVLVIGYLFFTHYLLTLYRSGELREGEFFFHTAALIASPMPLIPMAFWAVRRWVNSARVRLAVLAVTAVGSLAFAGWLLTSLNLWSPGLHPFGPRNAWYATQRWARENTPRDALFLTPPEKWWLYDSDWRAFSERSTVVTHAELLMVALAPSYFPEWRERFEQVAPGAIEQFGGNFFDNQRLIGEAYNTLTAADFARIAQRYGASYLVMEKPNLRAFPVVYENEKFIVYALR